MLINPVLLVVALVAVLPMFCRKVIAKRLQQSKHEIPHYYLTVECR